MAHLPSQERLVIFIRKIKLESGLAGSSGFLPDKELVEMSTGYWAYLTANRRAQSLLLLISLSTLRK